MAEPVKVVEPVKLAEPVKTVEPVLVPSVPPPSIIPERANHVKEATPEVVKKEVTPELEVTNHQVEEHPIIEVVEDVTVDGDLTKSDSQVKLKYEYNDGEIQIKKMGVDSPATKWSGIWTILFSFQIVLDHLNARPLLEIVL
jgi:hypothetical protein